MKAAEIDVPARPGLAISSPHASDSNRNSVTAKYPPAVTRSVAIKAPATSQAAASIRGARICV